jgi:NitT/TauT family transport system substrate-binding protein
MRRVIRIASAALLAWAVLSAMPSSAQGQKMIIGQGFLNTNALPLWVALGQGDFKKHGVEVELTFIRGGGRVIAALLAGEVRFATVAVTQVVGPVAQGADPVVILSFVNKMPYLFMAASHIRSPADLKGKRIGVATFGGAAHVASHMVLRQFGLEPKRDQITLIQIGTEPERLAALLAGSIDAAMMAPEVAVRLATPPFRRMLDLRTADIPWQHSSLITTRSFIEANPRAVEGVVRAIIDGFVFTLDPANKERVKQSIAKHLRLEKPDELEEAYKEGIENLASNPVPSLDGGATVLKLMAELEINKEAARLKPSDIMDPSIVEKLAREGALDRLKKR